MKKNTVYIDLENPVDKRKLEDAYTFLTTEKKACIALDEVQQMPKIFSVLRSVIDANRKKAMFILTGSASPELVKGVSESLAGRIYYTELMPIALHELPEKYSMQHHWVRGGFPAALQAKATAQAAAWMNAFIRSYVERDMTLLFGVNLSTSVLRSMLSMLAHVNGSIWSAENFSRSLGVTAPTVNRYLDFMEGAFLIHKLPAFYVNTKKRLVKAPKVYFIDSGMLHRMLSIDTMRELQNNPAIGASWEGYVVQQIARAKNKNLQLFYYRTHAGAECDVVLVKGHTPVACIEIKYSNAPAVQKGFYQSIEDLKPKHKFIITPGSDTYTGKNKIVTCGLIDFIKNKLPGLK